VEEVGPAREVAHDPLARLAPLRLEGRYNTKSR
jgi:hypothetical protein